MYFLSVSLVLFPYKPLFDRLSDVVPKYMYVCIEMHSFEVQALPSYPSNLTFQNEVYAILANFKLFCYRLAITGKKFTHVHLLLIVL